MADTYLAGPVVEEIAGEALTAGLIAVVLDGEAVKADKDNVQHRTKVRGIVVEDAEQGGTVLLQVYGPMILADWDWEPELPIYVGNAGELTQTYPAGGYVLPVAVADTEHKIFIDLRSEDFREEKLSLTFGYGDATPETIGVVPANKTIKKVELHITTAFDGSNPSLQVGVSGDIGSLLPSNYNDPANLGTYVTNPNTSYVDDTTLLLSITPGSGASAGSGLLVVTFQR